MDEFFYVAFYFYVVVFDEVAEVDFCADQGAEEFCYLGFGVVGDECDEEFDVPGFADFGVLDFTFADF